MLSQLPLPRIGQAKALPNLDLMDPKEVQGPVLQLNHWM